MSAAPMYDAIHRHLVETGEWDRLVVALNRMLSENGWTDDARNRSREKARNMSHLSFKAIVDDMQAATINISPQVKLEMLKLIRETIEQFIEH